MRSVAVALLTVVLLTAAVSAGTAQAQKAPASPAETVINFYRALKQKHYQEGFRHSVYRGAVEGLTAAELKDLEDDFASTFSAIPEKIESRGEQITGETAVVFLKFEGIEEAQPVGLIRANGEWLVGDKAALDMVKAQGTAFFFNTRMQVNEQEAFQMLQRMIGVELLYSRKFEGRVATIEELVKLNGLPADIQGGESSGYRFTLTVSADGKSFFATATPMVYGKSGRVSFYADPNGVRGEDMRGQLAGLNSPLYQPK